mmetsp:Transcript_62640/g.175079  ORF Transcript_62640/g.175079 Transcript_62640/m.175079 type:complete len:229 (+) Transcript_62640:1885-2571(+)
MAQRELDHLSDLGHLLSTATNVIVTYVVHLLLVLTFDGVTLAMDDGVGRHDHELAGVHADNLELNRPEAAAHQEEIALAGRPVGLQEVRLQVRVEEVPGDALDGVVERQHVHALPVRDIAAGVDGDDVAQADAEVLAHHLVHADPLVLQVLVREDDAHRVLALLALDEHVVAAEEVELLHLGLRQRDHRVVIVERLLDDEAVGRPLLLRDRGGLRRDGRWGGLGRHGC